MQALLSHYNMVYVTVGFITLLLLSYWTFKCLRWIVRIVMKITQSLLSLFARG